ILDVKPKHISHDQRLLPNRVFFRFVLSSSKENKSRKTVKLTLASSNNYKAILASRYVKGRSIE
ncbi:MAG: hypothetical protein EA338_08290, partial [Roseinatronobacter sp.]